MKKLILLLTILICSSTVVFAQLSAELDSITVTASRITTSISESGKSVSVITQEDIRSMAVTSVDELLRSLPGVNINARQGFGVQADVGIRGSTFSQVLFMLDNVPLNDPLTAHFNTNIPVSLSEIGQVELIRGPASTSFGADAVGGVVHIKTKMYLEREVETQNGFLRHLNADVGTGENGLRIMDTAAEFQANKWRLSASVRTTSSDGETFTNPGFIEGISNQQEYNSYFSLFNTSVAVSRRFGQNWSWYVRGGYDKRDFDARYFYTRSIFDESVEEITNRWGLTSLSYNNGNHRSEFNASYRVVDDIFDFNSAIAPANEHTTGLLFLNLSHQYEFDANQFRFLGDRLNRVRLMVGAQYLDKNIESTDRGNHQEAMGGIYAISSARWSGGLSITSSLRLQFDALGNADLLPQLSAAYNLENITLRSSIGQAIRTGDFTERYISSALPDLTPLRNIGNPDLKPEKSLTIDAGFDWTPNAQFKISPTFFYRSSSNLIDYSLTNSNQITNATNLLAGEDYFYASNISSSEARGVEIFLNGNFRISNSRLVSVNTGYTYIKTTSDQETVSRYIANHPSHQVSFSADYRTSVFSIQSQSGYYVRSPEAEAIVSGDVPASYFMTHLRVAITPFGDGVQFYSRIINLTDTQYQEILGAPMPGRWIMGGIRVSL